jgi:3-hydroxyacyl-CoA dehydrogenase
MALSIRKAAVLGAGIIGGGITFTIAQAQLDLTEAKRQLARQLKKEKITKALDLTAA